jgi:glucose-1-phosphate thymidylyltransferase
MKGLILSGGKGTRLRPLTYTSAKQLVPVANVPILFFGIQAIVDAGITDIGIVVGDTREEIKKAVGDGSRWGARVQYIEQEAPLGLAHAVLISESFLGGSSFVMYLGDNLIPDGISALVKEFEEEKPNSMILLAKVPNPESFGVAELKDHRVVRLEEKPKKPKSDLALVGVYMFDRNIFEAVKNIKPSKRNELEITDAIQYLIDHGYNVHPHVIQGWWKDTGKLEDMLEANRIVLSRSSRKVEGRVDKSSRIEGRVIIAEGAEIINSVIRGPAIIGAGTRIENSFVGPFTSIHENVEIFDSEIEHSIILQNCTIKNIHRRIEGSLVGRNVKIYEAPPRPKAFRFMLGDNSVVGVWEK